MTLLRGVETRQPECRGTMVAEQGSLGRFSVRLPSRNFSGSVDPWRDGREECGRLITGTPTAGRIPGCRWSISAPTPHTRYSPGVDGIGLPPAQRRQNPTR